MTNSYWGRLDVNLLSSFQLPPLVHSRGDVFNAPKEGGSENNSNVPHVSSPFSCQIYFCKEALYMTRLNNNSDALLAGGVEKLAPQTTWPGQTRQ